MHNVCMNGKVYVRKLSRQFVRYYPIFLLTGLRKTTKYLSLDCQSPYLDLNLGPLEYGTVVSIGQPVYVCVERCLRHKQSF
jgi:hypothetical protein